MSDNETIGSARQRLKLCNSRAKELSTCCKAQVGAYIYHCGHPVVFGWNCTMPDSCLEKGCHRVREYGEDSKLHRLPSDCYALHAEIHALALAAKGGISVYNGTIYVSRYPCEACARAIVAAGIRKVVYGGVEEISAQTKQIFSNANIEVEFIYQEWGGDTVD